MGKLRSSRRTLALGAIGVVLLAASLALPASSASSVAASVRAPAAETSADGIKPFIHGTVTIDPASITTSSPDVAVTVSPESDLINPSVSLSSKGRVSVDKGGRAVARDRESSVAIGAAAPTGPSTVTATLTGLTPDGRRHSASDTVWLDDIDGTVVASGIGPQDLTLKSIDVREVKGQLSAAAADAAREATIGRTNATVTQDVAAACAGVCVTGTALWTDSAGGTHPVPGAPVQIWDENTTTDQLVTTVTTDAAGGYSAAIDNIDEPGQGGRDIYVRVLAAGSGFEILDRFIESPVTDDAVTGTNLEINFVTNQVDENNTAFSLQNAMVVAVAYIANVRGSAFPSIGIVFPSAGGSFYDGSVLQVDGGDRWDWDVMLHEYGHYVADQINIEANPGGSHSSEDNLSDSRGSKSIGIPLAWGEGWPTYFAVSLLRESGTASLNIPNIGDTKYQDTEDQEITDDLETGGRLGEDNEFTNMSILWDLYDSDVDGVDDVALGTKAIWDLLDDNDPTTLSAAYGLFAPGVSDASNGANCIFGQYNVSPQLDGPAVSTLPTGSASPLFTWQTGNGGTHPNDSFVVEYRSTAGNLLFTSAPQAATSYTATAGDWESIRVSSGGTLDVTVVGLQTDAPATGPYRSCARRLDVDATATTTTTTTQPATTTTSPTTTTTSPTTTTLPGTTTTLPGTTTTLPGTTTTTTATTTTTQPATTTTLPATTTTLPVTTTTLPVTTTTGSIPTTTGPVVPPIGPIQPSAGLPVAPGTPQVVAATASTAKLIWDAASGSVVSSYRVSVYVPGNSSPVRSLDTGSSTPGFTVTGLSAGSVYRFTVSGTNAAGTGVASPLSLYALPPFVSIDAFTDRQFRDFAGRPATAVEASGWQTALLGGATGMDQVDRGTRFSNWGPKVDPVSRLYFAYFGRQPDTGGLGFWSGRLRAGRSLDSVSDYFARSGEFRRTYGSLNNEAFVKLVYQNVLGRAGEAGGVAYWTSQIDAGLRSRGSVMAGSPRAPSTVGAVPVR